MKNTTTDCSVIRSILFPGTSSLSLCSAVPETPSPGGVIHSRARANYDVTSVMETPEDIVNTENNSNEFEEVPPLIRRRKPSLLPRLPSDDSEDDSFLDIIPDLDIDKKKKKSNGAAEKSVNSDHEMQMIEDGNHNMDKDSKSNFFSPRKSRRKSILETLTPFDLNDDDLISKKIHCYKNSGNKSKRRSVSCSRSPLSVRKCASLTPGTGRRKSVSFSVSCSGMSPNLTPKRNNMLSGDNNAQTPVIMPATPKRDRKRTVLFEADNMLLTPVLKTSQILVRQSYRSPSGYQSCRNDNLQNLVEKSSSTGQGILSSQNLSTPSHKQHNPSTAPKSQQGICDTVTSVHVEDRWDQSAMATQPAASVVLEGVVAYVDVRIGNDNRSQAVKEQLLSLGAQIQDKLTSSVTHVIFRDGARGSFNKAKKRGLHIVSSLWVEACRENLTKAPEALYPSTSTEKYQSPALPHRLRKLKSMQPREFHEEELLAENRLRKRAKTQEYDSPILELPNLFTTPVRNKEARNSPLYGISHLLSPRQKHKSPDANEYSKEDYMLGSQPLNLDKSLARRLYDRYVKPSDMKGIPVKQQILLPENNQSSDIHITAISEACNTLSLQEGEQFNENKAVEEERLKPTSKLSLGTENKKKRVQQRRQSERQNRANENSKFFISEEPEHQGSISGNELNSDGNNATGSSSSSLQLALSENCDENESTSNKDDRLGEGNSEVFGSTTSKEQVTADKEEAERKLSVRKENCKRLEEASILDLSNYQTQKFQSMPSQGSQYAKRSPGGTRKPKRRLISIDYSRPPSEDLIIPSSPMQVSNLRQPYADLMINSSKTQKRTAASPRLSQFGKHPELCLYTSTPTETSVKRRGRRRNTISDFPQSPKRKASSRRKPVLKKSKNTNSTSDDDDDEVFLNSHLFTLLPHPRRSAEEFQIVNNALTSKSRKKSQGVICITSVHSKEYCSIVSIIKKLGGYKIVDTVDACTSHIVCGAERRTLNMLNGIARGCWILDVSWVYHSLEMDTWVSEEPFEMFTFCQGAKVNREKRALQGRTYKNSLFSSAGNMYVTDNCTPPAPQLKELLELCGANVVKSTRSANIIIGKGAIGIDGKVKRLQEKWILDSIQKHNVESVTAYLVT